MKKIVLLFILSVNLTLVLFAQSKSISKAEYDTIRQEAQAKVEKKIRKVTTVYKDYSDNVLTATRTFEQDFLPPDKSRWLVTAQIGNSVNKSEIIYIGDVEYRKRDDGSWSQRNLKSDVGGNGPRSAAKTDRTNEYSIEKIKVGKETHQILSIVISNDEKTNISDYKIWINQEGLIYKIISKTSNKTENVTSESVANYDYSLKNLKIEAPIK